MPKLLPPGVAELPVGVSYAHIKDATRRPHQFRAKDPTSRKSRSKCFAKVREGLRWAIGVREGMQARTMPTGKVHWATVAADYLATITQSGRRQNYLDAVGRITANITAKSAGDINAPAFRELVRDYLDNLVADPDSRCPGAELSPATKNKHLAVIRAVCHYARDKYRIPFDPIGGVKASKVRKKIIQTLTLDEARACVAPSMEPDPYFLRVALLLYLGLRERSEGLWLQWRDYDAARKIMQVREREGVNELKTGEREVPVPDELAAILARTPRQGPFILSAKIRLDADGANVEDRTDYGRFKAYLRKALLPEDANEKQTAETEARVGLITRHSLRHLYARVMAATGVAISSLKTRLGHTSISTTMIYASGSDSYEALVESWPKGQWTLRPVVTAVQVEAQRGAYPS
jgi:integrase